ncbi:MAG: hypothetical protein Kow0098_02750 [Ignavibacteriaceae bacterium]
MKKKIIFTAFLFLSAECIFSQSCCTAGTTASNGVERAGQEKYVLSLAVGVNHNSLTSAYESTNKTDDPLNRRSDITAILFEAEYGLSDRVSLLFIASYFIRERTTTLLNTSSGIKEDYTLGGSGPGDIIVLGKYEIIKADILSAFSFSVGGGAKLPTGQFRNEDNGTRLPIDLQPGTGAADLLSWLHASFKLPAEKTGFGLSVLYRYPGTSLDGYRYGDEIISTLSVFYYPLEFLSVAAAVKSRFAAEDYWGGRLLPSTGGVYHDLVASLSYNETRWQFRIQTAFPLYRNLKGIQLAPTSVIAAEIGFSFDLK